jgi:hypothetical protein
MINSAAITTSDPSFDFFPRESGDGVLDKVGLSPGQLRFLPIMNWYRFGSSSKVIPQIFHELDLFRWAQIKN